MPNAFSNLKTISALPGPVPIAFSNFALPGPELICINGEHKVTLYQEEGPLTWTPFELLSLGSHQKVISCAAADGIKGSTAFLVTETSCKSSKLWVMGPHSAEEGPGGGPFIGTMQRARLK